MHRIFLWTFKIIKSQLMFIGIDSSNKKYIECDFSTFDTITGPTNNFYAYGGGRGGSYGCKYSHNTYED